MNNTTQHNNNNPPTMYNLKLTAFCTYFGHKDGHVTAQEQPSNISNAIAGVNNTTTDSEFVPIDI